MERTKAEFRATREALGITQQSLADELGVKILSVKRWEQPKYPQHATARVWELFADLLDMQESAVRDALMTAGDAVELPYWMSAKDFDDLADEKEPGTSWTEANATRRAIAQDLRAHGVTVTWYDAAESR